MLRPVLAAVAMLALAPFAVACNCGSGGTCHCGDSCSCAAGPAKSGDAAPDGLPGDTVSMTTPLATLFAADTASPTTVHVGVENFDFTDNAVIHVGDTVQWDWMGGFHSVTSVIGDPESFDSGFLFNIGDTFSHTFTQPGTYWYYCGIHGFDNGDGTAGGMSAMVTVLPAPEPASLGLTAAVAAVAFARPRRRSA